VQCPAQGLYRLRNPTASDLYACVQDNCKFLGLLSRSFCDTLAGLALLNQPYAWIGDVRDAGSFTLEHFDQTTGKSVRESLKSPRVRLRVHCNFDTDVARFSFSTDAADFKTIGDELRMPYQLKTFQGIRYTLFNYNSGGSPGGQADFNNLEVYEPRASRSRSCRAVARP